MERGSFAQCPVELDVEAGIFGESLGTIRYSLPRKLGNPPVCIASKLTQAQERRAMQCPTDKPGGNTIKGCPLKVQQAALSDKTPIEKIRKGEM